MTDQANSFLGTEEQAIVPPTSDEKTMALLSHLLGLFTSFFGPLIIYLVKKDESKFVAHHAKEALNFMITVFLLCIVLVITVIGILLLWLVGIASTVLIIVATIKASEGKIYKYPLSLRLIK